MTKKSSMAMLLAYLVPGAGHYYLGYRGRAVAFFVIIIVLLMIGISIDGSLYTLGNTGGSMLRLLAALGSMGGGIPYFLAVLSGTPTLQALLQLLHLTALGLHGDVTSITFEYGTTFTLTAGLMNLLLVLDC